MSLSVVFFAHRTARRIGSHQFFCVCPGNHKRQPRDSYSNKSHQHHYLFFNPAECDQCSNNQYIYYYCSSIICIFELIYCILCIRILIKHLRSDKIMREITNSENIRQESGPFVDLTDFVPLEELQELDDYLKERLVFSENEKVRLQGGEIGLFTAKGYKHADSIDLTDRDTSGWCADAFTPYSGNDDFRVCRGHRGDPKTWRTRNNPNARELPGVIDFVQNLPFFDQTGKISIICNRPGSQGVEHSDIELPDLVSEFVWIRPPSSKKKFYVRDPETNEKHMFCGNIAWFDDHLLHNLEPVDEEVYQVSIRVDGRFTPTFRSLISQQGTFGDALVPPKWKEELPPGGLKEVFLGQKDGPRFLQEVNDPPESDDEQEYSEEVEEDDDNSTSGSEYDVDCEEPNE